MQTVAGQKFYVLNAGGIWDMSSPGNVLRRKIPGIVSTAFLCDLSPDKIIPKLTSLEGEMIL